MTGFSTESSRLRRTHLPERADQLGMSVRSADRQLQLDGAGHGLLDTTHFDTVRFPPPEWALEEFARAASDGETAYTGYRGSAAVRAACADSAGRLLGIAVDPDRNIAITTGTQGGLFSVLAALVDEGDTVALSDPDYLFVERMMRFLGANVVRIPLLGTAGALQPDLDALDAAATRGARLFLTSHPNNPTGAVFPPEAVDDLAQLAVSRDLLVVVDQLYCRLVYGDVPFTHLAALPGMAERTITMLGGSKTESLSGYRVGLVIASAPVIDSVEQVMAMTSLRAPAYGQHVLRRWFVDDEQFVRHRVDDLRAIRATTVEALRTVPGLVVQPRQATAYLWPDVSALNLSDIEVANALRERAGVIVSPGYQFGPSGIGHFRICYAREEARWAQALDRMTDVLRAAAR